MKKNLIMTLAVVATMGMVLTGCGGDKPDKITVDVQNEQETSTEVANPENQPLIDEDATQEAETVPSTDTIEVEIKENGETVSDEQVAVGDYLSEHGITITPQASVTSMEIARYNSDTLHERNVTITVETVPSDEEGYSDTIFKAVWDTSTDTNLNTSYEAYDRYTGVSLIPVDGGSSFGDEGGTNVNAVIVELDGKQYDCTETFVWDTSDYTAYTCIYTIHHPSEYDGVVFDVSAGTASRHAWECTEHTSCKLADHPEWTGNDLYFTASDK